MAPMGVLLGCVDSKGCRLVDVIQLVLICHAMRALYLILLVLFCFLCKVSDAESTNIVAAAA